MEPTISTAELIRHLGASAREIASLRLLFGQEDDFDRANAALALQRLRQHAATRRGRAMGERNHRPTCCAACVAVTAAFRWRCAVMPDPGTRETLITLPCTKSEARVIRLNARARGMTVDGMAQATAQA
jgi:hypothetical protein